MRVDRSPGPDGFGPAFYYNFWNMLQGDVMEFLRDFHAGSAPWTGLSVPLLPCYRRRPMYLPPTASDPSLYRIAL